MRGDYAERYEVFEEHHWWFRARRDILADHLKSVLGPGHDERPVNRILEIGTGPGRNLYTLYPAGAEIIGLEPDAANAERARQRGVIPVFTGTIESIPSPVSEKRYDLVTMFDVLEHIEDDAGAVDRVRSLLNPAGHFVLSVPAYQWMWGQQDVVNLHHRRYTRGGLVGLLTRHGFKVNRATYFNTLLFPPVAAVRLCARLTAMKTEAASSDFDRPVGPFNGILYRIFRSERALLRYFDLPFGVSILVSAQAPA